MRVAVTGMGVVSPGEIGVPAFWGAVVNGRSMIRTITHFDASSFPVKIAGTVENFDPTGAMEAGLIKDTSRYQQFALVATHEAMTQAGLEITPSLQHSTGVIYSSGIGGFETHDQMCEAFRLGGVRKIEPRFIAKMIPDGAAGLISIKYGAKGFLGCSVGACASSTKSIGDAYEVIKRGDADVIIAGGSEATLTPLGVGCFIAPKALSKNNLSPAGASRPFDMERDGFVEAEGAGTIILENWEFAKDRGAVILAEIVGYGNTSDANNMVSPDPHGDGAERAMRMALRKAGLEPDHIGYVCAHGTATKSGDVAEGLAIERICEDRFSPVPVSSIKGTIGHALGASGVIAVIASIKGMHTNTIPPTINLNNPDPACGNLDHVACVARKCATHIGNVLVNSFGFGGSNACLVISSADTP